MHVTPGDIIGNSLADELANKAALNAKLPLDISQNIVYYTSLVEKIQNRWAVIIQNLPPREGERFNRPPPPPIPSLESYFWQSRHLPYISDCGNRLKCLRCKALVTIKGGDPFSFLDSKCLAIGSNLDRRTPVPFEQLQVGTQFVHHTHKVYTLKGLLYCNRCGSHAGTGRKISNLVDACKKGKWGAGVLKDIDQDILPRGLKHWPCLG